MKLALLIGYGAIGRYVRESLATDPAIRIACVLERATRRDALARELGDAVRVIADLDEFDPARDRLDCAIECAGHGAVVSYVPRLLAQGTSVVMVSVGALAEAGLPKALEAAAGRGGSQLVLVSGAIGGIDAIASAREGGLDEVLYTGRKPPLGWLGTPAEKIVDLSTLAAPAVIFEGTAREAARLYPKNANVAATVSLAGIGLDRTRVRLIADPATKKNVHHVKAQGAFGEMEITLQGTPLAANPKTSSLAAFSTLRAARDIAARIRF